MSWSLLTYNGLRERLSSDELSALLNDSATPEDKCEEILTHVALDVVSRVNAGRRKRALPPAISTGLYVPSGAQRHSYILARRELTSVFPSLAEYNGEDRKQDFEEANNYLDDLANNNADSDDAGAESFVSSTTGSSFRISGRTLLNFSEAP
jgi:hypothetical protein